ncbi:ExeM/NucH family extracellular endonuclease [Zoogloea sp.]|uniref:ExeM/NucH family extracellular endonuclease n=1 Tax=Zoogloea sp. TaxID=49181 RepID=UPI0026088BFE|nr:ExeM/NucH family extracellular endonuclease [Zoogloea sp.]MDD3353282.1 ExeM/NucH family extracellular endonuclease [Zoogloea sp.]
MHLPNRLATALCAAGLLSVSGLALAASDVVISQLFGGGGNNLSPFKNDYVELFNRSSTPISLEGWSIQYASAAGTGNFASSRTPLSGTLQPGQYFLVQLAPGAGTGAVLPSPDASGNITMAATAGKVILANTATGIACNGGSTPCSSEQSAQIVDLVGFGSANFKEGTTAAPAPSNSLALFRAAGGCTDSDQNGADFVADVPSPRNSGSPVNQCGGGSAPVNAPIVASCSPLNVQQGTAGSVVLSASDADSIVTTATLASGAVAGISLGSTTPATTNGGSASVTLQASASVAAGSYPVSVLFANNGAQSASCTVDVTVTPAASITPIGEIQGSGTTSPRLGQSVSVTGVVTLVTNNGFFLQDPVGDGNPATSDGIYVFTSTPPTVAAGQRISLKGSVAEFNGQTQLTAPTGISLLASGESVTPVDVSLPESVNGELERYEGMLVRIVSPMTVAQNFFLGRFGQLTLSANGRIEKATNRFPAGSPEALALADENQRRLLVLDDGSTRQNPSPTPYLGAGNTVRGGDTVNGELVGVLDQGAINASTPAAIDYRLHPTQAVSFSRAHPRTTTPLDVGGNVKVASFNVLNYFNGNGTGGGFPTSRGASSITEFERQRTKIIGALKAINADVVGLMEIENDGHGATSAIQDLVNGLNAALGAGTYAVVPDPAGGTGSDEIKVAMIYKPGKLTRIGAALSDTSAIHNRPPLAQTFAAANGEKFSVVVNHFKSKGCGDATGANQDQGDGQGCYNAQRVDQSRQLLNFIEQVKASAADPDVAVIGDLNAYGKEDPILALSGAGLVDQLAARESQPYSYVFDGEIGYLDHALTSASLDAQVAGIGHWHINADEPSFLDYNLEFKTPVCPTCTPDLYSATPYRSSDHDPVLIGLNLVKKVEGSGSRDTLTGTAGDDVISGGAGADTLTGGSGADTFVYQSLRDAGDTITDFVPGTDRIDLRALLVSIGYTGTNPVADGYLKLVSTSAGTSIQIDPDGNAGTAIARPLALLKGVASSAIDSGRDFVVAP